MPLPKPRPADVPAPAATPTGWNTSGSTTTLPANDDDASFQPINSDATTDAVLKSVKALAPMGVAGVDPLQVLDGVKDGKATLTVPLQPGHYKAGGHGFDVKPGTVVHVQVDVKDGRIVPARDADGQPTGRGTQIEVDPPLNLLLWVKGKGAYVQDAGGAQAAFKADVGGWFDQKLTTFNSTKLSDVVRQLSSTPAPTTPPDKHAKKDAGSAIPAGLIRPDQVKFTAQLSMADDVVKAGTAKLDLAPGTTLKVSGDGAHATLDGDVNFGGGSLDQPETKVTLGPGVAHVHADYSATPQGAMHLKTQLKLNTSISALSLEHPRQPGDTDPDRLQLGNASLKNGELDVDATFQERAGSMIPNLTSSSSRLHGEMSGSLIGAKLTMNETLNDAELKLGPGKFKGTLDVSPAGNKLGLDITGSTIDVKDLQAHNAASSIGVKTAHVEGDLHLDADSVAKTFDIGINAKKLDVRIDGYKGTNSVDNVDFQSLDITGAGTLKVDGTHGMQLDGNMNVAAAVNDLKLASTDGKDAVDFTKGTSFKGTATHLVAGGPSTFELDAQLAANAKVKNFSMAATGITAKGDGTIKGKVDLVIRSGSASLVMRDAKADLRLSSGSLGSATGDMGLDASRGSKASLNVEELRYGSASGSSSIKLGPGSIIDATLDDGHLLVKGKKIDLEKGAHARFEMSGLSETAGELPALQGSLSLQTNLRTSPLSGLELGGIKIANAGSATGRVNLQVPDVSLTSDGTLAYRSANVKLDAKIGNLKPGEVAPAAPPLTNGKSPVGVLTPAQVKAESVLDMAGVTGPRPDAKYDAFEAAKHIRNGTLHLEVPVSGTVGKGYFGSAKMEPGTVLSLDLVVKEGKVVPSETHASFSKPGAAALETRVLGVHFGPADQIKAFAERENNAIADTRIGRALGMKHEAVEPDDSLRIQASFAPADEANAFAERVHNAVADTRLGRALGVKHEAVEAVAGTIPYEPVLAGLDHLPLDVGALVDRFKGQGGTASPDALKAFDLMRASISVKDATFTPGTFSVPGGSIEVGPDTKLSVSGTLSNARVSGHLNLKGVDIAQPGVALKGGPGSADLVIEYKGSQVTTTLDNLNVDTQYAVEKRDNGDYLNLATGHVTNGKLTMTVPTQVQVSLATARAMLPKLLPAQRTSAQQAIDAAVSKGLPDVVVPPQWATGANADELNRNIQTDMEQQIRARTNLTVKNFNGDFVGGRLTLLDAQKNKSTIELGSGHVDGEMHIDPTSIQVKGKITHADVAVRGIKAAATQGSATVDYARLRGTVSIDLDSKKGTLSGDAELSSLDVRSSQLRLEGPVPVNAKTRITGKGHLAWSNSAGLSLEGELHVDADVTGTATIPVPAPASAGNKPLAVATRDAKRVTIGRPVN